MGARGSDLSFAGGYRSLKTVLLGPVSKLPRQWDKRPFSEALRFLRLAAFGISFENTTGSLFQSLLLAAGGPPHVNLYPASHGIPG